MNHRNTLFISAIVSVFLNGVGVSAEEYCVKPIEFENPEKLDRERDVLLKPTVLVTPKNGGTPVFYDKSTKQEGYGYRNETRDYGMRPEVRYIFWGLNEKGNFVGPYNLKQDYYRGVRSGIGQSNLVHDPSSGSTYFKSSVKSEKAKTTGSGQSYGRLVEFMANGMPRIWSASDFLDVEKDNIGELGWNDHLKRPLIRIDREKMMISNRAVQPIPKVKAHISPVFTRTAAIKFDKEFYAVTPYRGSRFLPRKGDVFPLAEKGTLVRELRATADEGWYVGNVGDIYHDGLGGGIFTYLDTFKVKQTQNGLQVIAKKRFKPRSLIFPFRATDKCQVYSPILKRVIFCDQGTYLKNGRRVKIKGRSIPPKMQYLGDDPELRTAIFQSAGLIYSFDGEKLKVIPSPKFRSVQFKVAENSGRAFLFFEGQPFELTQGKITKIAGVPKNKMSFRREVVDTGKGVFYFAPDAIYEFTTDSMAKRIWAPPKSEFISHNNYHFSPTYIPVLKGILFGTLTLPETYKHFDFEKITKFQRIGVCSEKD